MMHEIDVTTDSNDWTADGLKVIKLKFISDQSEINSDGPLYPIEYAYQQFGDGEAICGYRDLSIVLCFTEATMFPHIILNHRGTCTNGDVPVDDVPALLNEHLVYDQRECLTNRNLFEAELESQASFQPPGTEVSTFMRHSDPDKGYALFRIEGELSEKAKCLVERCQSILFFFIEGVKYTDSDDPKFIYYILYETYHKPGTTGRQYRIMAYLSLYKYYSHPDKWRLRGAHTFVFPQFRSGGVCSKLLHAVNLDVKNIANIYDVTLETPAPELVLARDYATTLEVISMPEFAKAKIMEPVTKEKKELLRTTWKMYNKQAVRVIDILQYAVARSQSKEAVDNFKTKLATRIRKPFERQDKDYRRMLQGLDPSDMATVTSNNADGLDADVVEKLVGYAIEDYTKTLARLNQHSREFQNWLA
uniref:histone acetyltransferase n=1 Tax=Panagrellus redivivus TaxID=6233 RepID=A0A7E4ZSG3_PANRE